MSIRKECPSRKRRLLGWAKQLFFVLSFAVQGLVVPGGKSQEHQGAHQAYLPAKGEGFVFVAECYGVGAFGQGDAHHGVADQYDLSRGAVYGGGPVAVLGDGGVEQAVPVAVDGAFYIGGFKAGQLQSGLGQHIIGLAEGFLVQNGGGHLQSAVFLSLAGEAHCNGIPGQHIAHRKHLRQAVALGVQLCAVVQHGKAVLFGQVGQINAEQTGATGGKGNGNIAGVGAGGIAAGAGHGLAGQGGIGCGEGGAVLPVPHEVGAAGGFGKQMVLETETVRRGGKIHRCQLGLGQKAQGQISVVFQQGHSAIAVDIVEVGVAFHRFAFDHILQIEKQVGNRGAFLKAVAVVAVLGAVAQGLHEFRHLYIGGAGEGGDAVVAVQRAIVEGLGMGGFCPVEQVVVFVHVADHGGGVFTASGVEDGAAPAQLCPGEIHAEVDQIHDQFQGHDAAQSIADIPPLTDACFQVNLLLGAVGVDWRRFAELAVQKHAEIQKQEHLLFLFLCYYIIKGGYVMEEIIQSIANYGVGVICVAYLIYFQSTTMKDINIRLSIIEDKLERKD